MGYSVRVNGFEFRSGKHSKEGKRTNTPSSAHFSTRRKTQETTSIGSVSRDNENSRLRETRAIEAAVAAHVKPTLVEEGLNTGPNSAYVVPSIYECIYYKKITRRSMRVRF